MAMKLKFTRNLRAAELELATEIATPEDVRKLMDSMTWKEASAVMLTNDHGFDLRVYGSTEAGVCVEYTEGGKTYITKEELSIEDSRRLLERLAAGEPEWRDTTEFQFLQNADGSLGEDQKPAGCLVTAVLVFSLAGVAVVAMTT